MQKPTYIEAWHLNMEGIIYDVSFQHKIVSNVIFTKQ